MKEAQGLATRCIHAGDTLDEKGAIHTALYNHSTFAFPDTQSVLDVVEGRTVGGCGDGDRQSAGGSPGP